MFFRNIIALFFSLFLSLSFSHANSLFDDDIKIARHTKKRTRDNFILEKKVSYGHFLPKSMQGATIPNPGFLFTSKSRVVSQAGGYDGLPKCLKSLTKIQPRSGDDTSFRSLDIVVYQFDNKSDKKKAKKIGAKAIPYIEGDLSNPFREKGNKTQVFIRTLGIECLPTRIISDTVNGISVFKYFEGSSAWGN